jgi:hypothetical protein
MTGKHRPQILRTVVIAAAVAALTILVAIAATAGRGAADPPRLALLQDRHEAPPPAELQQMIMQKGAPAPGCLVPPHTPANPDPRRYGAWSTVLPAEGGGAIRQILGMQTVHTLMLPSGKILLASGSSWRNLAPIQYYPHDSDPVAPKGIFNRDKDPFRKSKLRWYYQLVNNAAIYDPENNTFYRIPHPVPVDDPDNPGHFAPNDLFCTGQQHLPDGNVLVTGGTQYYYPFRTGNRSTYIFDWKKEMGIQPPPTASSSARSATRPPSTSSTPGRPATAAAAPPSTPTTRSRPSIASTASPSAPASARSPTSLPDAIQLVVMIAGGARGRRVTEVAGRAASAKS